MESSRGIFFGVTSGASLRSAQVSETLATPHLSVRLSAVLQSGDLDLSKREEKTFVLEMVIHSADIANPCRSEKIYRQWTERVMQEFYEQGDLEKANGLPVSKFFDRTAPNVPKCQLGFIDFVVRPLMEVVNELLDIQVLVDNLASNRRLMELEAAEASAATPGT